MGAGAGSSTDPALAKMGTFNLQQCIVEYTWGDESATGMLERSTAGDQLD